MADEEAAPEIAEENAPQIDEDHPMDIVDESFEEIPAAEEEPTEAREEPPVQQEDSEEAKEKSRIQKESFLEIFRIAPKVKDILPDLRTFMGHPDVIEWDRKEVEMLVEIRIQEEKAKKKAEKASKKDAGVEKAPVVLADVIRSATGIDLAGILQKLPNQGAPVGIPPQIPAQVPPVISGPPPVMPPPQMTFVAPPPPIISLGTPTITSIRRGKAGFSTPHPNDIPAELRHIKPDLVAPIPDELRALSSRIVEKEVPAIPNELLPPEQRVYVDLPIVFVRPPLRKTLFLAGARCGKRSDRIKVEEKKNGKKKKKNEDSVDLDQNQPPPKRRGPPPRPTIISGINSLPHGLNKNSPLAVKRYHARQLAKDAGITLEEAMAEIEEQCNEFGGENTPQAKDYDAKAMELIKKHGDERWNQKYNYTPADHSKGIPGVDRPPSGLPKKAPPREPVPGVDRPPGDYDRRDREPIPGVDRPPGALDRREPIPGVDRPPGDYGRIDREPIPGVDRPPGAPNRREPIPGVDRPPGRREDDFDGRGGKRPRRNRGGVKERERKRRMEESGRGRGRGRGGGYDRWNERPAKHGRYDQRYDDYYGHEQYHADPYDGGYSDRGYHEPAVGGGYDDYYGRHDHHGYEDYSHHYADGGGYDQGEHGAYDYGREGTSDQYYQGQEATYYQEDSGHYYDQYYGAETQETAPTEYHATFAAPGSSNPPPPPG